VVTIILNHPRGWGGKPTGSHRDSRVAEISQRFGPGYFYVRRDTKELGTMHNYLSGIENNYSKTKVKGDSHGEF
jgi:hypothetical protein